MLIARRSSLSSGVVASWTKVLWEGEGPAEGVGSALALVCESSPDWRREELEGSRSRGCGL